MKRQKTTSVILLAALLSTACTQTEIPKGSYTGEVVESVGVNKISKFIFDTEGYVWMSGSESHYLFKTDDANIIRYSHDESDPGSIASNKVNDAILDENGVVWFATQKGVDRYDQKKGCFEHLRLDDTNSYVLCITKSSDGRTCIATRRNILELDQASGMFLRKVEIPFLTTTHEPSIFFDGSGKLWALNEDRLDCFDSNYDILHTKRFDAPADEILFDGKQAIWLSVGGRLMVIDTNTYKDYEASQLYPQLADLTPLSISLVRNALVLIKCTQGSVCVDEEHATVIDLEHATGNLKMMLRYSDVGTGTMAFGPNGGLWVALRKGGYRHYPSVEGPSTRYKELTELLRASGARNAVNDMKHYWFIHGSMVTCYDLIGKCVLGSVDVSMSLDGTDPYSLSINTDGSVLVNGAPRRASRIAILEIGKDGHPVVRQVIPNPHNGAAAFCGQDAIIVASRGARLLRLSLDGKSEEIASPFIDNACYASHLRNLNDGSVLICYTDHCPVIYNPLRNEVKLLEIPDLKQVYFSSSAQDQTGDLWLGSTDNGLFRYSPAEGAISRVKSFPEAQVWALSGDCDGNVFVMGEANRIYLYHDGSEEPRIIWSDSAEYPSDRRLFALPDYSVALIGQYDYLCFNRDNLFSKIVQELPTHILLTSGKKIISAINTVDCPDNKASIKINRKEEGLSLHIGLVPGRYKTSSYSYMYDINGFSAGPRETASNTFIPLYGVTRVKNKVKFWIRDNNRGAESDPFTLTVRMNLLWWEIAIPLFMLFLVVGSTILSIIFLRKKREAASEKLKREMTEKMNMDNIDFFANISHEFRTPLTLIHGALSNLEGTPADASKARGVIKRSTDRLLKLVSQMLDFNKLDHGVLKLNVKLEPVTEIFETTKMNFEIGASMKSIDLTLNMPEGSMMGWVDRDKIEKILYNLCSNALKYTPPGGAVTIDVSEDADLVLNVSVTDTGVGIPEEDTDAVFDRFYQTDSAKKAGGTGIGLYYTRALVNLHHGSIGVKVRKTEDGRTAGSIFYFSIPMAESEYSPAEKAADTDRVVSIDRKEMMSEYVEESFPDKDSSKKKLLIIDDDYEVVYYLKSLFADTYSVSFRFDAMSGYKMIEEVVPDVIICDVMMVDVDGIQLCRMVKDNIAMSHIPIIMLTAKSTMEDQIKSLGVGADAYVVKPFNSDYLQALVKSMIDNRERVKEMLSRSISVPSSSKDNLSVQDRSFMESMYSAMEESLQKGELDIDSMVETLGVSRSKLFYKLKALTGQTPNEFFTTYKLNYSIKLLKARKYKIAAISEMLGFSSASHFTALFKKQFGMLPSQYYENENQTE